MNLYRTKEIWLAASLELEGAKPCRIERHDRTERYVHFTFEVGGPVFPDVKDFYEHEQKFYAAEEGHPTLLMKEKIRDLKTRVEGFNSMVELS